MKPKKQYRRRLREEFALYVACQALMSNLLFSVSFGKYFCTFLQFAYSCFGPAGPNVDPRPFTSLHIGASSSQWLPYWCRSWQDVATRVSSERLLFRKAQFIRFKSVQILTCLRFLCPVFLITRTVTSCGLKRKDVHVRAGCLRMCLCPKCPVKIWLGPPVERTADPKAARLELRPLPQESRPPQPN